MKTKKKTTKKVEKRVLPKPLDQIDVKTLERYISSVDRLQYAVEEIDKLSISELLELQSDLLQVFQNLKKELIVWKDILGNTVINPDFSKPAPNSPVAIAKEKGVNRVELPNNEFDVKLAEVKKKQDEQNKFVSYHGNWGTNTDEIEEIMDEEAFPKVVNYYADSWQGKIRYFLRNLWNKIRDEEDDD